MEWQDPHYRAATWLSVESGDSNSEVCSQPQAPHSLLVFVAPFVSRGVVPEEHRLPFRAILPPLPGGIPLLLFQHKFFLCCLVLIAFIYCAGNVLPKPRNKQGSELNHLKTNNAFASWSLRADTFLVHRHSRRTVTGLLSLWFGL